MLAIPYCYRLVDGLPCHVVLILLEFAKCSKLNSLSVKFKLLVGDPNRQRLCGRPKVLLPNLFFAVDPALWPGLLFLNSYPVWMLTPWLKQYVVIHQVGW